MRDGIFAQKQVDGSVAGKHLILDLATTKKGYAAKFAIVLSDKNFRGSGPSGWDNF